MYALAIDVVNINARDYDAMVKRANKRFRQARLKGVRVKGKPTVKTWNYYEDF